MRADPIEQALTLPAPAKLNLFLHILGRRDDGYHDVQTLYQFIDFADMLNFRLRADKAIHVAPQIVNVAQDDNLVIKAARLLAREVNPAQGVDITLQKNIPMGSGLGGGSSDAATTLLALNQLWHAKLSAESLAELSAPLGADVPVFVRGHAAWAEGIGHKLTPMILPEPWYVVVIPPCHMSTQALFDDPRLTRDGEIMRIDHYKPGVGHNDFEPIARMDYPLVANALDWLDAFAPARLSGSGSTVFAAFDTENRAGTIAAQVPEPLQAVVAKGCNHSPVHTALLG